MLTWKKELLFAGAGLTGVTLYFLLENIALTYTFASNVGIIVAAVSYTHLISVGTSGLFAVYYKDATMSRKGNHIVLNATVQQDNIFTCLLYTSRCV